VSVDWAAVEALPRYVRAAMRALQLRTPDFSGLDSLAEKDWDALLGWLDRQQMTLLFGHACSGRLPPRVASRIEGNRAANAVRRARLEREYRAIAEALGAGRIPHVVLKGFTHGPPYVPAEDLRPQYDLDLLVDAGRIPAAQRALEGLGFHTSGRPGNAPADHCPPLVRRTGWTWKGDYFDPEIPAVVELHHRLWDPATEGFGFPALSGAAGRAQGDPPALQPADRAAYAAAHALRHLLRGSLKVLHVYELASLLENERQADGWRVEADGFQALVYGLCHQWFGCGLPGGAAAAVDALPAPVERWLARYAASPLTREFRPNKDEVWLHMELVRGWRSRLRVARRRLAPLSLPGPLEGHYDETRPPARDRAMRALRYAGFAGKRFAFHAQSLGRTLLEAGRWLAVRSA
jgi:hypothetical protein